MDNVTHSVAALLIAEGVMQVRAGSEQPPSDAFRRAVFAASLVSNNFPDLDFVYVGITEGKLGYLLHHRGHTHTLAAALPLGLATYAIIRWIASARKHALSATDHLWLAAVSFAGPLVHLLMDFQNNYGVHPYWPFDNSWRYGDSVFIVEPLFWAAAVPPLFFAVRSRISKALLGLIAAAGIVLSWAIPFVPWGSATAVTLLTAITSLVAWQRSGRTRVLVAAGSWLVLVAVFVGAGHWVRRSVARQIGEQLPGVTTHEVVSTPMPANPACWSIIAVQSDARHYWLRMGQASLAPALVPASRCSSMGEPTAPLGSSALEPTDRIAWRGEFSAPLARLNELVDRDCRIAAFLRFARVPFFAETTDGFVVGDLRFDRNQRIGFAEMRLAPFGSETECPALVPPWVPPRDHLLD